MKIFFFFFYYHLVINFARIKFAAINTQSCDVNILY